MNGLQIARESRSSTRPAPQRPKCEPETLPAVDAVLAESGSTLGSERDFFESRFGRDLSHVRIHSGPSAHASARDMGASAFSVGRHIVFGENNGRNSTHLLAHEIAHVIQQRGADYRRGAPLPVSATQSPAEIEADRAATSVANGQRAAIARNTPLGIYRQTAATPGVGPVSRTIEGSSASVSWIDPASPAGARVPDPAPPATITEAFVTGSSGFRFANYLHAFVNTPDGTHLTGGGFYANSGISRGPSYLGIPSRAFSTLQDKSPFNEGGIDGIEFTQTAGARTISAGVIGGVIGGAVGGGVGIWAGAKIGALAGSWLGPAGAVGGAIVGGLLGGGIGYSVGSAAANRLTNFPPIWTRIKLRLKADGSRQSDMAAHSYFPSNNFYADLVQTRAYSALAFHQGVWESSGWGAGNPWGITRPLVGP